MTLTQTAIITKQIITISIIALILGIASFIGYKIWYAYYLSTIPPVEEKPDLKFGILPPINFPNTFVSSSNFSYTIDTTTGNLPKVGIDPGFEKFIKVYFVIKPLFTLLSSEKAQALAEKFNLLIPPDILSETRYQFKENNLLLSVDLDSGNFQYNKESTDSAKEKLDGDNKLIADFHSMLDSFGILREELKTGRSKIMYLRTEEGELTSTQDPNQAEAAQISIWPKNLGDKQIFTPEFNKSLVNGNVLGSANNLENYLSLNFTSWTIDETTYATYPTKSADVAFEDLRLGKGVVVIEPLKPQVSITSIYLGYFMSENYNIYLQPIYIFEGPNFVAYVSAISEQYQNQATQN